VVSAAERLPDGQLERQGGSSSVFEMSSEKAAVSPPLFGPQSEPTSPPRSAAARACCRFVMETPPKAISSLCA